MSLLRKVGKTFVGFFFTIALIATVMIFSVANFTQLENVRGIVTQLFQQSSAPQFVDGEERTEIIENLRSECRNKETAEARFGIDNVIIKCSDLNEVSDENLTSFVSSTVAENVYYKKYGCDFVSCLRLGEQIMPLIITELAHNFYKQALNYLIIATIVLGALFLLAIEGVKNKLKGLGFSLLWSSVPFLAMSFFMDRFVTYLTPTQILPFVQPVVDSFFAPTFMVYVYILIAGIALVVAGYVVRPEMLNFGKKS